MQHQQRRDGAWHVLAVGLVGLVAAARLAYLAHDCPLDLAPDEAHYWDWSRHLDWSYYSKGPLVAYLIRLGTAAARPFTSNEVVGVRLPAVACGSLLLLSLYTLTYQSYGKGPLALAVVALALTHPLFTAGSSLMTIDAPYTCCWGWALVAARHAILRRGAWAWPVAGLLVGLGILAKYTMVLFLPSVGLFLLTSAGPRRHLFRPGFWVMTGVAALCCLPILVWNAQHDWVTLRHVGGQAGVQQRGLRWLGPLEYVGVQGALLLGFWFVGWAAALVAHRPWRDEDAGRRYLWWTSVPMFGFFLLFSFKTREQPNWPVTAYLSGGVLLAGWLARQLGAPNPGTRWLSRGCVATACAVGLGATTLALYGPRFQPVFLSLAGPATERHPVPLRRLDPTCRLRGWRYLAAEVDRLRNELRAEGVEPILAGTSWTIPGELGFYCAGHPTAYSLGLALGDRHSQYDWWRPNPVQDPERFAGSTLICVGGCPPQLADAFATVEAPREVTYRENGHPVATWTVTVCRGYRGFTDRGVTKGY